MADAIEAVAKFAQSCLDSRDDEIAKLKAQVKALTAERDDLREAVRVLGHRVHSCEHMLACYRVGRRPIEIALDAARYTAEAVDANPIARAAVEGGKES